MRTIRLVLLFIGTCLLFWDCSFNIYVRPIPRIPNTQPIELKVGLLIDESNLRLIHSQSGLFMIGMGWTWKIHMGTGLKMAAEHTFKKLFTQVEILRRTVEFKNQDLIMLITPKITHFNVSQALTASLTIHCKIIDREGKTVYESTVATEGSSEAMTGCLFGVFGGEEALSKTSSEAFNRAFEILARDIISNVNFKQYLNE